jgi:hypothetical protein
MMTARGLAGKRSLRLGGQDEVGAERERVLKETSGNE